MAREAVANNGTVCLYKKIAICATPSGYDFTETSGRHACVHQHLATFLYFVVVAIGIAAHANMPPGS
jgi:hypothetical protein